MNKLPNGWTEYKLKDLCVINYGKGLGKSNIVNGNIPVYSSGGIIGFHNTYNVNSEGVIIGRKGNAGSVFYSDKPFFCIDTAFYIEPNNQYDLKYLFYKLVSMNLKNHKTRTAIPGLIRNDIYKLSISIPPLDEQKLIASALSKIDAYLENTIKLIEEKERFKRGIAKKLLTCKEGENIPEARFKGFEDEWETVMLGDILSYEQPKDYIVKSEEYNNKYKYPVLTAGKTFILGYTNEEFGIYNKLPVIIFDDFTTDAQYVDFPFKVKSSAIKILKSKYYNTKLIYELIKNIKFNARTHKRYYISEYQYLKIKIPKSIKEQEDISGYLSLLDKEIDNLKKQKELIKEMKRGAMQKLLSGEVRLVDNYD